MQDGTITPKDFLQKCITKLELTKRQLQGLQPHSSTFFHFKKNKLSSNIECLEQFAAYLRHIAPNYDSNKPKAQLTMHT